MTREQFINLRIGDEVVITAPGKNRGKRGIVDDIIRGSGRMGIVYIKPIDCQFEFANPETRMSKDGFYGWTRWAVGIGSIKEPSKSKEKGELTEAEKKVILKIAKRNGCDRDGDVLWIFVKEDSNDAHIVPLSREVSEIIKSGRRKPHAKSNA